MIELVALEIDLRAAEMPRQPLGEEERARASHIVLEIVVEFLLERGIGLGRRVGGFELEDQRHERFGDITAAIGAEMSVLVRLVAEGVQCGGHGWSF